ncbi:MAG: CoA pyrophosphatase [Draconibacterium sp.]
MVVSAEYIKEALSKQLPGSVSHQKVLPRNRSLIAPDEMKGKVKHSSVLLLLFITNNELTACLIKRPLHMKFHPGQIALPGGRVEKNETELETAFRETFEEIGIEQEKIEILGSLSDLYVEVSQFMIHPFVGWLREKPSFKINHNEVEKIILFPLKNFKSVFDEVEIETVRGKLNVPCIKFNGEVIWGATAMLLSEFFDVINS